MLMLEVMKARRERNCPREPSADPLSNGAVLGAGLAMDELHSSLAEVRIRMAFQATSTSTRWREHDGPE